MRHVLAFAGALGAAVAAAACSSNAAPGSVVPAATTEAATAAPAQTDTAAAAKGAAQRFLTLYSAGQWDAAWQYLSPADKAKVPEKLFAAFHDGCPAEAAGMAYEIQGVTLAGKTAVVTYTIPAFAKTAGSATMPLAWVPAAWGVELASSSLNAYSHGSAAADVKAAKAAGECSSN